MKVTFPCNQWLWSIPFFGKGSYCHLTGSEGKIAKGEHKQKYLVITIRFHRKSRSFINKIVTEKPTLESEKGKKRKRTKGREGKGDGKKMGKVCATNTMNDKIVSQGLKTHCHLLACM